MKTLMMGTAAAALLFAGSAYAENEILVVVEGETMTMDQYREALGEPRDELWFDAYDVDRDGMLTRDEFLAGEFATYDIDDDEMLSQEEIAAWNEENLRYSAMRSGRMVDGAVEDNASANQ